MGLKKLVREFIDLRIIPANGITPEEALIRREDEDFLREYFADVISAEEMMLRQRLRIPMRG